MPMKTFLNLSKERKRRIIDAALKEFILHDYRDASLTRIIQTLGLAKGSFYRYFGSKRELYAYLIVYGKRNTAHIVKRIFSEPSKDVFDGWVRFYLACAEQDNAYPLLGWFGNKLSLDRHDPILGDVPLESKRKGLQMMRTQFIEAQKRGEIRNDLDVDLMIFSLLQIQEGILDYLTLKHGLGAKGKDLTKDPLFPLSKDILRKELEGFAEILRSGMAPRNGPKSREET